MGAWGAGLYSCDYALDLRGSIAALSRLPFDGDEILARLRVHEQPADDEQDEEHTIFWLVTAEQFTKRGIICKEARDRALDIIETGKDIARMTELGLPPASAKQRKKKLDELAVVLRAPVAKVVRRTLKSPQPILMQPNTAWRYPTQQGKSRNPYFATAEKEKFKTDGWGALIVFRAERAFGWLAWYVVAPVRLPSPVSPKLVDVLNSSFLACTVHEFDAATGEYFERVSVLGGPGTVTKQHLERMELECIGEVEVNFEHVPDNLYKWGINSAVKDISISNHLDTLWATERRPSMGPLVREWLCK